jgi:hypothetical protein
VSQTNQTAATRSEEIVLRPERMTAEDEAIFLRRMDRIEFDWMYEEGDRADAAYMRSLLQQRRRFDLMPIAMRIGG